MVTEKFKKENLNFSIVVQKMLNRFQILQKINFLLFFLVNNGFPVHFDVMFIARSGLL